MFFNNTNKQNKLTTSTLFLLYIKSAKLFHLWRRGWLLRTRTRAVWPKGRRRLCGRERGACRCEPMERCDCCEATMERQSAPTTVCKRQSRRTTVSCGLKGPFGIDTFRVVHVYNIRTYIWMYATVTLECGPSYICVQHTSVSTFSAQSSCSCSRMSGKQRWELLGCVRKAIYNVYYIYDYYQQLKASRCR